MRVVISLLLLLFSLPVGAQVFYGKNNFIEYHRGSLPIIISVPHGGLIAPDSIPDRTCNNPTTVTDSKTIELALQIDTSFYNLTGCHIHLVICNLKRTKIDCNRNIDDGACEQSDMKQSWLDFHHFIDTAQMLALSENNNKAFYIDLHGHGKADQRLELGYLLSDNALELSDSILNTTTYINKSSLKNLVQTNVVAATHSELLRGDYALGTKLGNAGYPSVPSKQIPKPDTTTNYFDGGYNTENYTSKVTGNLVNGLQIECNNTGVRDTYANRKKFADSLASAIFSYLKLFQDITFNPCLINSTIKNVDQSFYIYPTMLTEQRIIYVEGVQKIKDVNVILLNQLGEIVSRDKIVDANKIVLDKFLPNGFYYLIIDNRAFKIMLN